MSCVSFLKQAATYSHCTKEMIPTFEKIGLRLIELNNTHRFWSYIPHHIEMLRNFGQVFGVCSLPQLGTERNIHAINLIVWTSPTPFCTTDAHSLWPQTPPKQSSSSKAMIIMRLRILRLIRLSLSHTYSPAFAHITKPLTTPAVQTQASFI